jgi:hypothetical protein
MESKSKKARGTQVKPNIQKELGPLMKAIDNAVLGIKDERQRQDVRMAVSHAVYDAIRDLAQRGAPVIPDKPSTEGGMGIQSTNAVATGLDAIKTVKDLGFVEFTTGLINGTFDAIINATIKQMKAYAELVADLSKTLSEFQAENVTPAEILAYLSEHYPDGQGGTSVRSSYSFKDKPADPANNIPGETALQQINKVGEALVRATSGLPAADQLVYTPSSDTTSDANGYRFGATFADKAFKAVGKLLAKTMIEHLRAMAREGMARIVITDGELLSKLTFRVDAMEVDSVRTSQYKQRSFSASFGASFAASRFRASLGIGYGSLNCSAVNTESFDSVTMSAEIIGQVRLKFQTQTFAPVIKDEPIS